MKFSLEEKLKLLSLKDWHTTYDANGKLPEISMYDGPCGIRWSAIQDNTDGSIHCYPAPHVVTNSWDKEIARRTGMAIASDCIDNNIDVNLAPGINIKRTPVCGRNYEYFSEDPYLTSEIAGEYIEGCQSMGVASCLKHFCCNNREWDRLSQGSDVDYRTLREIYAKAFEIIIKKHYPQTMMTAYNPVNGINCSENEYVVKGILRNKLGYDGVILSDWDAVHDVGYAVKASIDIVCGFEQNTVELREKALNDGIITEEELDKAVERIVKLTEYVLESRKHRQPLKKEERTKIAIDGARAGMVLLKNEGNVLPIKKGCSIALLGNAVNKPFYTGGGCAGTWLTSGPKDLKTCLEEIYPDSVKYKYELIGHSGFTSSYVRTAYVKNAMDVAYDSDYTVLVVGNDKLVETEALDRSSIKLDPMIETAILSIAESAQNLIVVLETGSVVDVSNWIDKVPAVLYAGYAGEGINVAIAEILTGKTNPSGRLSETFIKTIDDCYAPLIPENPCVEHYSEGVLVGYRYYDTKKIPVAFPFGYGLSYSTFEYSDFRCERISNTDFKVFVTVKNTSMVDGADVVQLYVKNVEKRVVRPEKELRRFEKVFLKSGESKTIEFSVNKDCFEYFNVCYDNWHFDGGRYEILICRNVSEIVFTEKVKIEDSVKVRKKVMY